MKISILSTLGMASPLLFVAGCEKESLIGHQPEKNPGTLALAPSLKGLGGITTDFFAKYATEEMIIHDFVVKTGTVPVVLLMGGDIYAALTQSYGMIRIGKRVPEE